MNQLTNTSFSNVRGFGYQPSYAATGLEIWNHFNADLIEREIERGKKYFPNINTIRLWLSFDAFVRNGDLFRKNFSTMIDILAKYDLQAMPTLFNNWHSIPDFGGIAPEMIAYWNHNSRCRVFTDYLDAVVKPHAQDPRIRLWDLCNEPFNSGSREVFTPWLQRLADYCRTLKETAPITVGVGASVDSLKLVEPICDVLTPHSYYAQGVWVQNENVYRAGLDEIVAYANQVGKPMFAGETGWGALDDKTRVSTLQIELRALTERGMGFCIHMLHHSLVGDGHRAEYGVVSEAGFMGCIEADGSIRAGHELINHFRT